MIRVPKLFRGISAALALVSPSLVQAEPGFQPPASTRHVETLPTSGSATATTLPTGACSNCNLGNYTSGPLATRQPHVQFMLDGLIMTRDDADSRSLLMDTVTNEVLLNTGDLSAGTEPGVRLGLIFYDNHGGNDLEFSFLGIDEFGTAIERESQNPITFPFFGGVPANPRNSYTVRYFSEINSGEINLRRRMNNRVTLLGGMRFLELNERFNIDSDGGRFASDTDNDLYGFQIGGDLHLATICRSILFANLKSGVYYNNIDVNALAQLPSGGLIQFIDDEDEVAYVGEVSLGVLVPMGPQADLRVGYEGLYLDGVALAPDQSDNYSLFTSSGSADQSTLLYHGAFIGFDLFW